MPLRVGSERSGINKTEMGSETNDKVGTSLITAKRVFRSESNDKVKISSSEISVEFLSGIYAGNFFNPSAKLGRVQVARHNLEIKMLYIYLIFITLFLSGVGAMEFRRNIEKRWDEERNRKSTPSQTWLILQPRSNSWGDSKIYNKVNLVKDMISYKPRINTKYDERNM